MASNTHELDSCSEDFLIFNKILQNFQLADVILEFGSSKLNNFQILLQYIAPPNGKYGITILIY